MSNQHVYPDTQYLHAFIFPSKCDEDIFCKNVFNDVLHNANSEIKIQIPFTVVGETINNIKRKKLTAIQEEDTIRNLLRLLEEDNVNLTPPTHSCFEIAKEIRDSSYILDNTDILITSYALCDRYSTHFLVSDEKILTSAEIAKINTRLHNDGFRDRSLKITSEF